MVGPGIGGVIAQYVGRTAPFWFAFVGSGVILALIWGQLGPHRPRRRGGERRSSAAAADGGAWFHGLHDPPDRCAVPTRFPPGCGPYPTGWSSTDPDAMEKYRFDWSSDVGAGTPVAVVRAEDAGAGAGRRSAGRREHRVPVVPRGAGSRACPVAPRPSTAASW